MSKRYMASPAGLKNVPNASDRQLRGGVSKNAGVRAAVRMVTHIKISDIRVAQATENGIVDLPFELVDKSSGEVLKKIFMTEHEANKRNLSVKSIGYFWRRSGY